MSGRKIYLGTYTVTEAFDHRMQFETAAWTRTLRIEPGEYEVWGYENGRLDPHTGFDSRNVNNVWVKLTGICTHSYFGAGAAARDAADRGKEMSDGMSLPTYNLERHLDALNITDPRFQLVTRQLDNRAPYRALNWVADAA